MFGIRKKNIKTPDIKALTTDTASMLDDFMSNAESTDELLNRLGLSRKQVYDATIADDEIESCREDLRGAMQAATWRIWGDDSNEDEINRLYKNIRKQLPVFIELALTAKLSGYTVAEYVYKIEEDGFLSLDRVINKSDELEAYKPLRDGSLQFVSNNGEDLLDTKDKYLLLQHRATAKRPMGEMALARLYPATMIRKHGIVYAHQFLKRYAQPYVIGKLKGSDLENDLRPFVNKLYSFLNGGAIAIGADDDVELLKNEANAEAFKRLEQVANARIQKFLIGKVKISDLENGSRAAQETEEETKNDRVDGYLELLSRAIQHALDAIIAVNQVHGLALTAPAGLWFEFEKAIKIDSKRAERDALYLNTGRVEFTKDYYTDILGFEEHHIEIIEPTVLPTQLSAGAGHGYLLSESQAGIEPFSLAEAQTTAQKLMKPKLDKILSALDASENYDDFLLKLNKLDISDDTLADFLALNTVQEYVAGLSNEKAHKHA